MLGVTMMLTLLLMLQVQPPQFTDTVVTKISRSLMRGDTLFVEPRDERARVKLRQRFLIRPFIAASTLYR